MRGAPRSSICPPSTGDETASERHQRRLGTAVALKERGHEIVGELGLRLELRNGDAHWQVRDGKAIIAEWWPESGRFVARQQYARASKAHDVEQFGELLRRAWGRSPTPAPAPAPPPATIEREGAVDIVEARAYFDAAIGDAPSSAPASARDTFLAFVAEGEAVAPTRFHVGDGVLSMRVGQFRLLARIEDLSVDIVDHEELL